MVEDLTCGEVATEALLARHAEEAVHLASYLRGDTERSPILLGYVDGLDESTRAHTEEVLTCTVTG